MSKNLQNSLPTEVSINDELRQQEPATQVNDLQAMHEMSDVMPNGPASKSQLRRLLAQKRAKGSSSSRSPNASGNRGTVPKGARRFIEGVNVRELFKPQIKTKNAYNKVDLATPEIAEIDSSEFGAALFHKRITAAATANKDGAAVYVYPRDEYQEMRLFMTPDGMAGFALVYVR